MKKSHLNEAQHLVMDGMKHSLRKEFLKERRLLGLQLEQWIDKCVRTVNVQDMRQNFMDAVNACEKRSVLAEFLRNSKRSTATVR